jgi:hypothetical protein
MSESTHSVLFSIFHLPFSIGYRLSPIPGWARRAARLNRRVDLTHASSLKLSEDSGILWSVIARYPNVRLLILHCFVLSVICAVAARPANDNFVEAEQLLDWNQWIYTDNTGATRERGEPRLASGSDRATVWYFWDAPAEGFLRIRMESEHFRGYPVIALFTGSSVRALTRVQAESERRTQDSIMASASSKASATFSPWTPNSVVGG